MSDPLHAMPNATDVAYTRNANAPNDTCRGRSASGDRLVNPSLTDVVMVASV